MGRDNTGKRERILKAARQLMMQKGVAETSLNDIARAVGISKGTLYYYYPSKADLIYDITASHFDLVTHNLINWIINAKGKSALEILQVVFETILGAEMRTKLHLYLLQEAALENKALHRRFQNTYVQWRMLIKEQLYRLMAQDKNNAEPLSFLMLAALDGFAIQSVINGEDVPLDEIMEQLSRLV